jgi:hypothetical protein
MGAFSFQEAVSKLKRVLAQAIAGCDEFTAGIRPVPETKERPTAGSAE